MFKKILMPVDLAHLEKLEKALSCGTELAKTFDAEIVYAGVTTALPGALSHTPAEYAEKLKAFAQEQSTASGVRCSSVSQISHDVSIDVDNALLKSVEETGADLVVMASHVPGIVDYVWPSHGGRLASHAKISVMLVR
ncbi:universal stress protein [Pseudooceanicola sp. HF7]|uniref:universal stress protein n=1 Tax=Pseudooceanicola sp. HF7 TaxID=2721560 RepID=UPI0014310E25|nr:universal stress protein [Pseudooceanicola sp. HF7]NIZ08677.1 universal stress protein [Pseudooceanicola sp. HF7]